MIAYPALRRRTLCTGQYVTSVCIGGRRSQGVVGESRLLVRSLALTQRPEIQNELSNCLLRQSVAPWRH